MSDLKTFNFSGLELRVLMIEGEPWFVANDVCRALDLGIYKGVVHVSQVLRKLNDDEVDCTRIPINHINKTRLVNYRTVSESGLYKLIMRSDKPEARKFQDWVTREVLPSIRKTGGYLLNEEARDTARADDRQAMPMPEGFAQIYM